MFRFGWFISETNKTFVRVAPIQIQKQIDSTLNINTIYSILNYTILRSKNFAEKNYFFDNFFFLHLFWAKTKN